MEESSFALVVGKLYLFKRLSITFITCANPLTWWQIHENQFPNVGMFAKQILGIPKSQFETKQVFILVSVLPSFKTL